MKPQKQATFALQGRICRLLPLLLFPNMLKWRCMFMHMLLHNEDTGTQDAQRPLCTVYLLSLQQGYAA
jgi:hypothetical protein